jgi:hypothetical protein
MSISIKTTGSTLAEVPSVTAAVEHLQELGYYLSQYTNMTALSTCKRSEQS